jgi:acetate kinase
VRVLVLNCGSSSVKCALVDAAAGQRLFEIRVEDIGKSSCHLRAQGAADIALEPGATFETAIRTVLDKVRERTDVTAGLTAVAHRVVHGGAKLVRPTLIDDRSLPEIEQLSELAPLHNPPAVAAIRIARSLLPDLPHVAVFDTAFHSTLPEAAREYALPRRLSEEQGIRRFGFHGASHAHVAIAVAAHLRMKPETLRIVSCHLGNGASVTAIDQGRSVETSMGMTPMEGLIMGTRTGDIDPGVLLHLLQSRQFDVAGLDQLLNKESGLTGFADTNNMQEIERRAVAGDDSCQLAIAAYAHRVRKYIGAYAAVMGGVDVIAFTGGIGENSAEIRYRCARRLEFLGAALDEDANRDLKLTSTKTVATVSSAPSHVRIVVVRADEELMIARETQAMMAKR